MNSRFRGVAFFLASCAYLGYFPIAPGTAGSAAGVVLDRALRATDSSVIYGVVILLVIVVGVWVSSIVEKESGKKDPSLVVVDELAGMLLSYFLLPLSWIGLLVGFLVFRLFDIVKPLAIEIHNILIELIHSLNIEMSFRGHPKYPSKDLVKSW